MILNGMTKMHSNAVVANAFGLFGGGYTTSPTAYTDKYTYSGDTVVAGTGLGVARYFLAATGNSTVGIFGGGNVSGNRTDKYTYSGDTVVAGTVLGLARIGLAATGNSTVGIFGGGGNPITAHTDKYTYSGDTVVAGTVLGVARYGLAACSSTANGLI